VKLYFTMSGLGSVTEHLSTSSRRQRQRTSYKTPMLHYVSLKNSTDYWLFTFRSFFYMIYIRIKKNHVYRYLWVKWILNGCFTRFLSIFIIYFNISEQN